MTERKNMADDKKTIPVGTRVRDTMSDEEATVIPDTPYTLDDEVAIRYEDGFEGNRSISWLEILS